MEIKEIDSRDVVYSLVVCRNISRSWNSRCSISAVCDTNRNVCDIKYQFRMHRDKFIFTFSFMLL